MGVAAGLETHSLQKAIDILSTSVLDLNMLVVDILGVSILAKYCKV